MNQLEQLKKMTTVVADTGDFQAVKAYQPRDATTNPSLLLKAAQQEAYGSLVEEAVAGAQATPGGQAERVEEALHQLAVIFGREILRIVPGRVSTETDARLSFDTEALLTEAHRYMTLYRAQGIGPDRVLIKIASTWEGIRAAELLESQGIHCNLTLMFSLAQAVACAEAGVTLIPPFVGRIYDWYRKEGGGKEIPIGEDPGVASVASIYNYYRKFGYPTQVMGASFRKAGQIVELAGCDLLTISPELLDELAKASGEVTRKLSVDQAKASKIERIDVGESNFRWHLNEDAMATEKLAEGVRKFNADWVKLRRVIAQRLEA